MLSKWFLSIKSKPQVALHLKWSSSSIIDNSSSNQTVNKLIYPNKDPINVNLLTQIRTSELGGKYQLFDGKGQPFLRADYKPRSPCILCRYSPSALTTVGRGWSISAPHMVQKTSALWAPMLGPGGKGGIWSGTLMLPSQWTNDTKTSPHSSDHTL